MQAKLLSSPMRNYPQPLIIEKYHNFVDPELVWLWIEPDAHAASKAEADCSLLWSLLGIVSGILLTLLYFFGAVEQFCVPVESILSDKGTGNCYSHIRCYTHIWKLVLKHANYSFDSCQNT